MIKYDELIRTLEQKQNRTPKEEAGLRELKKLEECKKEIDNKIKIERENLAPESLLHMSDMSDEYKKLLSQSASYARREKYILLDLGLLGKKVHRPAYTPMTEEQKKELRKRQEEESKRIIEENKRKKREKEFAEWKRKKESGELEFEEYKMRQQAAKQQAQILEAINKGLADTQSAIKENAEQTARAEEWYRARRKNYRIQDEMLRDFLKK